MPTNPDSTGPTSPLQAGRLTILAGYARAAARYWLRVFPLVRHEVRFWERRARRIPDARLRTWALEAQRTETAKIEGAAAFATMAPAATRATLVRAQVAFVSLYNYVDALSERPGQYSTAEIRQLHGALLVALQPEIPHGDYYAESPWHDDGGYLRELVEVCRSALATLPSYETASVRALDLVQHVVMYQSLNLPEHRGGHAQLARWVQADTAGAADLRWWEHAAGSIRGVGVVALMTAAACAKLTEAEADATCTAYQLWVEALCTLLDSAADEEQDAAAGQRSLLSYYASPEEAAERLRFIASEAVRALSALPDALDHLLILTGLMCSYLVPPPNTPMGRAISRPVLATAGSLAVPVALVFRVRRAMQELAPMRSRAPEPSRARPASAVGTSLVTDSLDSRRTPGS